MKNVIRTIYGLAFLLVLAHTGCQAADALPDGFYVQDETGKSPLKLVIKDPEGKSREFAVYEYTNITVRAVLVYSLKPYEDAFQVQMNVVSSDTNWSKTIPVLVVQGKPYLELSKSASEANSSDGPVKIPATISLKVSNEPEANLVKRRLSEKLKIAQ